jgi:hypothetical protein
MKAPLVTLSPEELFAISPEVHNRLREAITPKRVPHETVLTNAYIEQASEEEAPIVVPDVYETYLNNLAPGERPIPLNVAEESYTLRSIKMVIDNKEEIEGIIDPGSQIIAMSEGICHDLSLITILPSNSICNQLMEKLINLLVWLEMSLVGLATSLSIFKFMLFGLQHTIYY